MQSYFMGTRYAWVQGMRSKLMCIKVRAAIFDYKGTRRDF